MVLLVPVQGGAECRLERVRHVAGGQVQHLRVREREREHGDLVAVLLQQQLAQRLEL
jgi:hypothetical protein